jgi:SAM-dependent methyltransferase
MSGSDELSNFKLPQGLGLWRFYERLQGASDFSHLAAFSERFLANNVDFLKPYARSWVADPLNQWSRRWEYVFVYQHLRDFMRKVTDVEILDAGSGITFFPFMIDQEFVGSRVTCLDIDQRLVEMYRLIQSSESSTAPAFSLGSMDAMPFPPNSFDAVYSVSVLEHMVDPVAAIAEMQRVLKPGGRLMLTFDISLDNRGELSVAQLPPFLQALEHAFKVAGGDLALQELFEIGVQPLNRDVVTTIGIAKLNPAQLPWRFPKLVCAWHDLKRCRVPRLKIKNLTFACFDFIKQ